MSDKCGLRPGGAVAGLTLLVAAAALVGAEGFAGTEARAFSNKPIT